MARIRHPVFPTRQHRWIVGGLLLFYSAFALICCFKNAEFSSDDANWVRFTQQMIRDGIPGLKILFYPGASGSAGPLCFLASALHGVAYLLHPSLRCLFFYLVLWNIATHWLLIDTGRNLWNRWAGYGASALYFFSPAFLTFYAFRPWQVVYLPSFIILLFWSLTQALRSNTAGWWILTFLVCGLSVQFHPAACLLIPPLFFVFDLSEQRLNRSTYAKITVALAIGMFPYLNFLVSQRNPLLAALGALIVGFFFHQRATSRARVRGWVMVSGIGLGLLVWGLWKMPGALSHRLEVFFDTLASPNEWISWKMGESWNESLHWIGLWSVGALWFGGNIREATRYPHLSPARRALLGIQGFSLFGFVVSAIVLPETPHQWVVFLFPLPYLTLAGVLLGDRTAKNGIRLLFGLLLARRFFFALLLATSAGFSLLYQYELSRDGGRGMFCSTLGEKREALDWIFSNLARPRLFVVDKQRPVWNGCAGNGGGWDIVKGEYTSGHPQAAEVSQYVYIAEEDSIGFHRELIQKLRGLPGVAIHRFRAVTLYISPIEMPRMDVAEL